MAFHRAAALDEDLVDMSDDVPANAAYLAGAFNRVTSSTQSQHASANRPDQGQIISDVDGETIRMLDPKGLKIIDDYLAQPNPDLHDALSGYVAALVGSRTLLTKLLSGPARAWLNVVSLGAT